MAVTKRLTLIRIARLPGSRHGGRLLAGPFNLPCALGAQGLQIKWREGDLRTPVGIFALRQLRFRADRITRPKTRLPARPIKPGEWWCDIPADRAYNRLVRGRMPPPACEEHLQRTDHLYDIIIEIGFNDQPVVRGKGSGIFWHVARANFAPTAGCVATRRRDLQRILPFIGPQTRIRLG